MNGALKSGMEHVKLMGGVFAVVGGLYLIAWTAGVVPRLAFITDMPTDYVTQADLSTVVQRLNTMNEIILTGAINDTKDRLDTIKSTMDGHLARGEAVPSDVRQNYNEKETWLDILKGRLTKSTKEQ